MYAQHTKNIYWQINYFMTNHANAVIQRKLLYPWSFDTTMYGAKSKSLFLDFFADICDLAPYSRFTVVYNDQMMTVKWCRQRWWWWWYDVKNPSYRGACISIFDRVLIQVCSWVVFEECHLGAHIFHLSIVYLHCLCTSIDVSLCYIMFLCFRLL